MAKRGAYAETDEVFKTKCAKSDTTLDDVSSGLCGIFSLTDPVLIVGVHWSDHGCNRGCVECRRNVDTQCSIHPSSESKASTLHSVVMESPSSPEPTPTKGNELTSTMPAPLEREDDPEFCGYGAHTSPISSDADTDSVSELRFTPAVHTLPKASASMGGPISPTPPTGRWSWSSDDDDDNYRGVVDDCADAIVRHVRCVMNSCCRARVANEVWACFGVLMREAMEPARSTKAATSSTTTDGDRPYITTSGTGPADVLLRSGR